MVNEETAASVAAPETSPAPVAASPTAPSAKLSEGEIFDNISQSAEEPSVAETEAPPEAAAESETTEEIEAPAPELDLEAVPDDHDNFQKFKAQIKEVPELRGIIGRHAAFTEMFPDFAEAKSLREQFPDRESAEQTVSDAQEWGRVSELLSASPDQFLSEYAEVNPAGLATMAREFPKLLEQTNRQEWIAQRTQTVQEVLDNAILIAQQNNDQSSLDSIVQTMRSMGLQVGASQATPRTDPRDAELAKLRREREELKGSQARQQYESFQQAVESSYQETVLGEIEAEIKAALVKSGNLVVADPESEKLAAPTVKRMVKDVWERLDEKLKSQPETSKAIGNAFKAAARDRRMSESDKRSILDFVVRKAKATRPAILREVVNEWTQSIIGANRKTIAKQQTVAAQTKDSGKGPGSPPAKAATSNGRPPLASSKKLTEDQIFASIGQ